jgi:two-component system, chemotaxis family, CheB/CheR fusion protein
VALPREVTVPLGLVLHELATNAAKHGARSVPGGSVELPWSAEPAAGGMRVTLSWRERGGPPIAGPPEQEGFGTTLIKQGLPAATVERRFERDGLVCTIKFWVVEGRSSA